MSVFKIVGNYYSEMMSFTNELSVKHNGLQNFFTNATSENKKSVIRKLSDLMMRIDNAFEIETLYWEGIRKEQRIYVLMNVMIIVISLAVLLYFIIEAKHERLKGLDFIIKVSKYLNVFYILMAVVTLILINIRKKQNLCKGQKILLKTLNGEYARFMFNASPTARIEKIFLAYGYWLNSNVKYKTLLSLDLQGDQFNFIKGLISGRVSESTVDTTNLEIEFYNMYKNDIEISVRTFNENGIEAVKYMILKSSPILMLKEAKNIMKFYYLLANKPFDGNEEQTQKTKENTQSALIDEYFLTPMIKFETSSNSKIDDLADPIFKEAYDSFLDVIIYAVIYFESDSRRKHLMDRPDCQKWTVLFKASNPIDFPDAYTKIIKQFYYDMIGKKLSSDTFIFNKEIMSETILKRSRDNFGNVISERDFLLKIGTQVEPYIIAKGESDFLPTMQNIRLTFFVNNIIEKLNSVDIELSEYRIEVLNKLSIDERIDDTQLDHITEVFDLAVKRQNKKNTFTEEKGVSSNTPFKSQIIFNEFINEYSITELTDGLNLQFYKMMVEQYYMKISESINLRVANMTNIYYNRQTTNVLLEKARLLAIIGLSLLFTTSFLTLFQDVIAVFKTYHARENNIEGLDDCELKRKRVTHLNNFVNIIIKCILYIVVFIFGLFLVISITKKSNTIFAFNLEVTETNTNALRNSLSTLNDKMTIITNRLDSQELNDKLKNITKITNADKQEVYDIIKEIIDKFEKCNFLLDAAKEQLPFPYIEVLLNGFVILIAFGIIMYVATKQRPIYQLLQIKSLHKLRDKVRLSVDIEMIEELVEVKENEHNTDLLEMALGLKVVIYTFIILFLMYYSVKLLTSSNDFRGGLYNSFYYEDSICY